MAILITSVFAYDKKIQSEITYAEQMISKLSDGQAKTNELANYYRDILQYADEDETIQNLKENWSILDLNKQTQENKVYSLKSNLKLYQQNYLGKFKLTAYCPCRSCSGEWGAITSTGVIPQDGVTIAVDPNIIPYGTKVYIEDVGVRVAQDCGGAIKNNKIDVYVSNHENCFKKEYNQKSARVWLVDE